MENLKCQRLSEYITNLIKYAVFSILIMNFAAEIVKDVSDIKKKKERKRH